MSIPWKTRSWRHSRLGTATRTASSPRCPKKYPIFLDVFFVGNEGNPKKNRCSKTNHLLLTKNTDVFKHLTPTHHVINLNRQDELEAVLTSLACSTKPADLDEMLKEADLDADGKINYEVTIFGGQMERVVVRFLRFGRNFNLCLFKLEEVSLE